MLPRVSRPLNSASRGNRFVAVAIVDLLSGLLYNQSGHCGLQMLLKKDGTMMKKAILLLMIIVLLVQPSGLFGREES